MVTLVQYLIEANIYACIFYAFYWLFLKSETFSTINRWALIALSTLAFLLPLITVKKVTITAPQIHTVTSDVIYKDLAKIPTGHISHNNIAVADTNWDYRYLIAAGILFISLMFITKLGYNIFKILSLYRSSEKFRKGKVTHVLLSKTRDVFSFFNWLFYHPGFKDNEAILAHEMTHINQKHSLDLLFFGVLRAVNWFNPLFTQLLKDIRITHEFIADEHAAGKCRSKYDYAALLIGHSDSNVEFAGAHGIFSASQLEKRIAFLGKKRSSKIARFKLLGIIPLIGIGLFVSAFKIPKDYGLLNIRIKKLVTVNDLQRSPRVKNEPTILSDEVSQVELSIAKPHNEKIDTPIQKPSLIVTTNPSGDLDELYDHYTNEINEFDLQLAEIIQQRSISMKKWGGISRNYSADYSTTYAKMVKLDDDYKLAERNVPTSHLSKSVEVAALYFDTAPKNEAAYFNKIIGLLNDYQQLEINTNKLFILNTTDPAINQIYYKKKNSQRDALYKKLNALGNEIKSNVSGNASELLETMRLNLEMYWKKDEINDKINQRNAIIRARNLLKKSLT